MINRRREALRKTIETFKIVLAELSRKKELEKEGKVKEGGNGLNKGAN
jgi:hypothetical protein